MKIRIAIIICFLSLQCRYCYAQQSVSIYEYGIPVTDYEDNFKNLINNWNKKNVSNADEYEILECSFVETLSTWERYNYYRNYFSSDQPVMCSTEEHTFYDEKKKKEHVLIIRAGFGYTEFYDTRGYPDKLKPIFTDEFREKAKKILSQELNIDTMSLYNFRFHKEKRDTTAFSWNHSVNSRVIISPDSLSQNFMDVFIEGKKDIFELEAKEAQDIILEELLSNRLNRQFYFNNTVKTGDKVFVIKFKYIGQVYSNYIICSAESKKVVWDNCFSRITIVRL